MTKYEWESELKKKIKRLPKDEQNRVIDYYNELFEDRIEMGWQERQIIANFGTPSEVAARLLSDYSDVDSESTATISQLPNNASKLQSVSAAPPPAIVAGDGGKAVRPPRPRKSVGRRVLAVLGGIVGVILSIIFWSVGIALIVSGWVLLIGGLAAAVLSLFYLGGNTAGAIANLGTALLAAAIGLLLAGLTKRLIGFCTRSCRRVMKKKRRA